MSWRRWCLPLMWLGVSSSAAAFNEGGHHYTTSAVYYDGRRSPDADPLKLIEAFCAQLPDLAEELDAITQRSHRLFDMAWGIQGRCTSDATRHMVAAQFYLHGLTGGVAVDVRKAAIAIIQDFDRQLTASRGDAQAQVNLSCAKGFAAHLLGDTHAHTRLYPKPGQVGRLYPTGLGHWQDMHRPDYMLSRDSANPDRWNVWIKDVAKTLDGRDNGDGAVAALAQGIATDSEDFGEAKLHEKLVEFLPSAWKPYPDGIGKLSTGAIQSRQCKDQLGFAPKYKDASGKVTQLQDCGAVWVTFLSAAVKYFPATEKPDSSCAVKMNTNGRALDNLRDGHQ